MNKVVIKLGGAALQNIETLEKLSLMVKDLILQGMSPVIIHGGGPAINHELTLRGISWKFINGQRQTTPEMMKVIEEVLAIDVNNLIVGELIKFGVHAIGLSGARDQILFCSQIDSELGQVGKVEEINLTAIHAHPELIPVIAPIGFGAQGEKYNINADWAAAKLAVAMGAQKLIFLTDQNGILNGEGELIEVATSNLIQQMIDSGVIHGGMFTKVMTMISALDQGIGEVHVMNALLAHQYRQQSLGTRLVES